MAKSNGNIFGLDDKNRELSAVLRQLRNDKGLTQSDVAENIGVKTVTISAYESGRVKPNTAKLGRLARLYDVDVEVLSSRAAQESGNAVKKPLSYIPELEDARSRVARMDEMLYYYKNLSNDQRDIVLKLARKLAEQSNI